mmetsp:Transcript_73805/g.119790  ORF Transcript_73805/g.119790 Transcript_73805/m.119790 type:complete len:291 (-) Transcript_73805:14-886(-)
MRSWVMPIQSTAMRKLASRLPHNASKLDGKRRQSRLPNLRPVRLLWYSRNPPSHLRRREQKQRQCTVNYRKRGLRLECFHLLNVPLPKLPSKLWRVRLRVHVFRQTHWSETRSKCVQWARQQAQPRIRYRRSNPTLWCGRLKKLSRGSCVCNSSSKLSNLARTIACNSTSLMHANRSTSASCRKRRRLQHGGHRSRRRHQKRALDWPSSVSTPGKVVGVTTNCLLTSMSLGSRICKPPWGNAQRQPTSLSFHFVFLALTHMLTYVFLEMPLSSGVCGGGEDKDRSFLEQE